MDGTWKYHPKWSNPVTKEQTWYALIDKWILAHKLRIPKIQVTDHMKLKKKEDQSVDTLVLLRRGNKIPMGEDTKCGAETEGKDIQRLSHLGIYPIYSHQTQTLLWIPISGLLTGAWYSCLLRGPASAWQIQRRMLSANHWTEHRVPSGGRTEGAKGVFSPIEGTTILTNQYPHPRAPGN